MTLGSGLRRGVVSLRIAGRDVRKQPRDGLLVASLVGLPVAVVMAVGLVVVSGVPTPAENVAAELGLADAWVSVVAPAGTAVNQYTLTEPWGYDTEALEGEVADRDPASSLPAGARLIPLTTGRALVSKDDFAERPAVVVGAAWDPALSGPFEVVSGHTPSKDSEAMISPALAATMSIKLGDTIAVGDHETFTVVGQLSQSRQLDQGAVYVPTLDVTSLDGAEPTHWFVVDAPIDVSAVAALNADGMVVFARDAILSTGAPSVKAAGANAIGGMAGSGGVGLFGVVLLAGAAFAVGMRRRQQTMAMLAATGANRGMLVRIGVARGAVLGGIGSLMGVPLGILGGWAWLTVLFQWGGEEGFDAYWGFHLKPLHVLFAAAFGVIAGVLASVVPSLSASKVDVIAALRGTRGAPRLRSWVSVGGTGLLVAGGAVLVVAGRMRSAAMDLLPDAATAANARAGLLMAAGFVVVFAGAMLLVPAALRGIAGALGSRGVGARMAARDSVRNLGRTVPVVAAIAVTVVMAASVAFSAAADERLYQSQSWAPPGDAYALVETADDGSPMGDPKLLAAAAMEAIPDATTHVIEKWPSPWDGGLAKTTVALSVPKENVCPDYMEQTPRMTARERAGDVRCALEVGTETGSLVIGGVDELRYLLGHEPSEEAKATLEGGGAVVFNPLLIRGGTATLNVYDTDVITSGDNLQPTKTLDVPAAAEAPTSPLINIDAVVSPKATPSLGADVIPVGVMIDAGDTLTPSQRLKLNGAVASVSSYGVMFVDEPSRGLDPLTTASLVVVLLVAGTATGLALGLARAEARRDDFTLASLGAAPALVKRIAAWQAAILVFVSVAVGVGCALALNWASSQSDLRLGFSPPWLIVAAMLVVLPAVVASIAWVFTRQPRAVHFRLAA